MDFVRIYAEIAFAKVAKRFLTYNPGVSGYSGSLHLPENCFVDEGRVCHPELSDDTLEMIYRLGKDEWSRFGLEDTYADEGNIFRSIAYLALRMCDDTVPFPQVHFKDLFRWREVTQLLGEDFVVCAMLAFRDKDRNNPGRRFDWPTALHNDNPHLTHIFSLKGLCELHSHLRASTYNFEITWVSLMNHISGKERNFKKLAIRHEPSRETGLSEEMYVFMAQAAKLRWLMYRYIQDEFRNTSSLVSDSRPDVSYIDSLTGNERSMNAGLCNQNSTEDYDYISLYPGKPMAVYAGERWLLYRALMRIYATNDHELTRSLYRYVLIKSLLRSYIIQLNGNIGFSNFKRYQDLKTDFLDKRYSGIISNLPMWEAKTHNYTTIFETRISPPKSRSLLLKQIREIAKSKNRGNIPDDFADIEDNSPLSNHEWGLIFHFLKIKDKKEHEEVRNMEVRNSVYKNNHGIKLLRQRPAIPGEDPVTDSVIGIDAAGNELSCRPEAFGQAFRFLRHFGFNATFHAGEDFYDIADGLRAIDEAITFLDLRPSERIGHAIALGIDARKYYEGRHFTVAMSKQYMLDNSVWVLMRSREYGITVDPRTEWFLNDIYQKLIKEIGYSRPEEKGTVDMRDYWDSMALRGDNPEGFLEAKDVAQELRLSPDTWEYYALLDNEQANTIRRYNADARKLFQEYHTNKTIRNNGDKVKTFTLPCGYAQVITKLQDAMMRFISKRQLCIECCPSSNTRIGRLRRFDEHPIFRFMPIRDNETRYPLAVTVNTDDLGVFSTSLPNEYSLLALALLKKKDYEGNHLYSTHEVYDWIGRVIDNGHKFTFLRNVNQCPREIEKCLNKQMTICQYSKIKPC